MKTEEKPINKQQQSTRRSEETAEPKYEKRDKKKKERRRRAMRRKRKKNRERNSLTILKKSSSRILISSVGQLTSLGTVRMYIKRCLAPLHHYFFFLYCLGMPCSVWFSSVKERILWLQ
jgi:hypothetical protein